ncbi:MAG TPA: peptide deformylase [Gaiellaceae bacterium]|nr:peptide deformylase [Gaiellaceae bacterium]
MGEVEGQVRHERLDAEREARRRAALAQVRQYPDTVLRMAAREVELPDASVPALVERMTRLMHEAHGVGLAAPQVGVLRRVLVYQAADEAPVVALVNPRLTSSSDETATGDEGCLSLGAATVIVPVERAESVRVEASSPEGEPLVVEAEGLEARVIQHELDHLDGVLILDRTTPEARREALAKLRPQPVLAPLG